MTLVTDASVAAKWLFEEADSERARHLLEDARDGRLKLIAPEIISAEIANVLWKRVQRGQLQFSEALTQYARFQRVCPAPVGVALLTRDALKFALQYRHSIYDCLYVALSHQINCGLITADEELYQVFSSAYPGILLLKNWER